MVKHNILKHFEDDQFEHAVINDMVKEFNENYNSMMFGKARQSNAADIIEYVLTDINFCLFDDDFHGKLLEIALEKLS